jgi:hypothetical protein
MRSDSSRDDKFVSKYKTLSRIKTEANHTIIANVGDQFSDLVGDRNGDHAERCFKVPTPSTIFQAIQRRAAASNAWRARA